MGCDHHFNTENTLCRGTTMYKVLGAVSEANISQRGLSVRTFLIGGFIKG